MNAPRSTARVERISDRAGRFLPVEAGRTGPSAFLPRPLPPDPPLAFDPASHALLDRAGQALGRLDGATLVLADPDLFLPALVRKEAVLSCRLAGSTCSLSDLLLFDHDPQAADLPGDTEQVADYVTAVRYGLERIARNVLPLNSRLLREVHRRVARSGRDGAGAPGRFRREQNWVGSRHLTSALFVPPPWTEVETTMADLDRFVHEPADMSALVKAALAHAQFETIHPFREGNGRVGRVLATLVICSQTVLRRPLLPLSLKLSSNRDAYFDHLQRIRVAGAWEEWVRFFLEAVAEAAESATAASQKAAAMVERERGAIGGFGRAAPTALRVHDHAIRHVVVSAPRASRELGLSLPPVYAAIGRLEEIGVLRELTGRRRDRVYMHADLLALLEEDMGEARSAAI